MNHQLKGLLLPLSTEISVYLPKCICTNQMSFLLNSSVFKCLKPKIKCIWLKTLHSYEI